METNRRDTATARLDVAHAEEATAAHQLAAARGSTARFHATVQLRAAETEVAARSAWVAWTETAGSDG